MTPKISANTLNMFDWLPAMIIFDSVNYLLNFVSVGVSVAVLVALSVLVTTPVGLWRRMLLIVHCVAVVPFSICYLQQQERI